MYPVTQEIGYVPTGAKEHKRSKERYVKSFAPYCYVCLHLGKGKRGLKISHSWATFLPRLFKYYMEQILAHINIRLVKIRLARRRRSVCEINYIFLE